MTGRYTFGDSDLASRRLALVADAFEAPTRALVQQAIPRGRHLVIDLGCGPGFTTRLLATTCSPTRVLGLDSSARFVELARRTTEDARVDYACHDVTQLPLPDAPADAIFVRLLLAHLPDPFTLVESWRGQVQRGGVLVVDEIESMEPPPGVLRDYEELVVALVATEGGAMYAGPILEPLGGRCVEHLVPVPQAARMYAMNLATWRGAARERGLADDAELDRLADALDGLAGRADSGVVRWVLRQLVLRA